jgi:hypothetical protein
MGDTKRPEKTYVRFSPKHKKMTNDEFLSEGEEGRVTCCQIAAATAVSCY